MAMTPRVLMLIGEEIQRAKSIHRPFPYDNPERAALIMGEEFGEVARATLDMTRPGMHNAADIIKKELIKEIIHVAATSVMWLEDIIAANDKEKKDAGVGKRDGSKGAVTAGG